MTARVSQGIYAETHEYTHATSLKHYFSSEISRLLIGVCLSSRRIIIPVVILHPLRKMNMEDYAVTLQSVVFIYRVIG